MFDRQTNRLTSLRGEQCSTWQSNQFAVSEKIASKYSIIDNFKNLMSRKNANSKKFYSPFTINHSIAFTLAEVLITLGIIGVVAALTIPALINNYQKMQYVSQLKKFYSEFSQALEQLAIDSGCPGDFICTGIFSVNLGGHLKNDIAFVNKLRPYLKIDKICGGVSNGASNESSDYGCFGYQRANRPYKLLNGTIANSSTVYELEIGDRMWTTLANGSFFGVCQYDLNCLGNQCAQLYVDVNGIAKPNQLGRDVFWFKITPKATMKPYIGNDCTSSGDGHYCASKILNDGWQMNY